MGIVEAVLLATAAMTIIPTSAVLSVVLIKKHQAAKRARRIQEIRQGRAHAAPNSRH